PARQPCSSTACAVGTGRSPHERSSAIPLATRSGRAGPAGETTATWSPGRSACGRITSSVLLAGSLATRRRPVSNGERSVGPASGGRPIPPRGGGGDRLGTPSRSGGSDLGRGSGAARAGRGRLLLRPAPGTAAAADESAQLHR